MSIPVETIREIQQACYQIDVDRRWLIVLISDTGMRLAEAAGLHIDDLHLEEEIPYANIKTHPWRSLRPKAVRDKCHWLVHRFGLHSVLSKLRLHALPLIGTLITSNAEPTQHPMH